MSNSQIYLTGKSILFLVVYLSLINPVYAALKTEIDIEVSASIEKFKKEVLGAEKILEKAERLLVLPDVVKAGFGIGGEYGEGALLIKGKTVDYYSTAAA